MTNKRLQYQYIFERMKTKTNKNIKKARAKSQTTWNSL